MYSASSFDHCDTLLPPRSHFLLPLLCWIYTDIMDSFAFGERVFIAAAMSIPGLGWASWTILFHSAHKTRVGTNVVLVPVHRWLVLELVSLHRSLFENGCNSGPGPLRLLQSVSTVLAFYLEKHAFRVVLPVAGGIRIVVDHMRDDGISSKMEVSSCTSLSYGPLSSMWLRSPRLFLL